MDAVGWFLHRNRERLFALPPPLVEEHDAWAAGSDATAFITLRKPDESIKHDSNDQEPKLYERGKEIIHRRVLRRCDIKQPTFP